jgi:small subunit ribosomal protein S16
MLTIRLTRKGKKNQPFFRVVVVDKKRSSKGGRSVEDVGFVDPLKKRKSLNKERILYWISKGAQPSDTVHNLLITEKIIEGKKVAVVKAVKKVAETKTEVVAVSTPETVAPAPASLQDSGIVKEEPKA